MGVIRFRGLILEWMVEVRIKATQSEPEGDRPIQGEQEHPPAFELLDVKSLVRTTPAEALGIPRKNDMPQCHRCAPLMPATAAKHRPEESPTGFDYAVTAVNGTPCGPGKQSQDGPQRRDWQGPEIGEQRADELHIEVSRSRVFDE